MTAALFEGQPITCLERLDARRSSHCRMNWTAPSSRWRQCWHVIVLTLCPAVFAVDWRMGWLIMEGGLGTPHRYPDFAVSPYAVVSPRLSSSFGPVHNQQIRALRRILLFDRREIKPSVRPAVAAPTARNAAPH